MRYFSLLLGLVLLAATVGTASAVTWTNTSGCWTATDGSYTLVMWNATASSTYVIPVGVTSIEYLVVAGGGGGGRAGGGGAGGILYCSTYSVTPNATHTVVVGAGATAASYTSGQYAGGSGPGNDGANSSFGTFAAKGGGGGGDGSAVPSGRAGGSGGGAGAWSGGTSTAGLGVSGQGYNGSTNGGYTGTPYPGGAGGGSSHVGYPPTANNVAGDGGNGTSYSITGTAVEYAGGGGGSFYQATGTPGVGHGGGGAGGTGASTGTAGAANTGGGGGGGMSSSTYTASAGGSGIVIIKYLTPGAAVPVPSFTSDVNSGTAPLAVQFTDTSVTSPTAWNWSFTNVTPGNNTQVWWSTDRNATRTFGVGNYKINLNVTNSSGYATSTANYWVNVSAQSITANFTGTPTSGTTGQVITFTDSSTGNGISVWNWSWQFGDGNTSSLQNPTTTYSANGVYDVNLTIYNSSVGYSSLVRSGYITISDSGNLSGWNTQDIMMDEIYTLTLTFKDASTLADIPVVNVTDSRNDTVTTTIGIAQFHYNYTSIAIYATSSGYYGKTSSYIIDRDRDETVYLTKASSIGNASVPIANIYPHYVSFHVKEGWGTALSDVEITALGVSTSTGNWDWIVTLLGVPLDEVPINGTLMTQTTDTLGTATFYMIPTGKYNLTFTKAGYSIPSMVLVPQDDDYIIWTTGTDSVYFREGQDELVAVNITVDNIPFNASYNYLNLTYYDSTGHTTGGYIDVLQKNATPGGTPITLVRWTVTNSSFTQSVGVSHPNQISGYVNTNVTHTDFGQIKRSYPFQMNSVPVSFLGFGAEIALIVALGMMLFTAMLGGATHAKQVVFVVVIEAVVFYSMHWFQALVDRGVPDAAIILALGLMAVVAIAANMDVRKKREKY